jgi:hypothetical protein
MRRILVAALLGLVASMLPAVAQASPPDVIRGGCGFDTNEQATLTGGQNVGVIYDLSVTATGGVPALPMDATVTCWIDVNSAVAPGTQFSYSGAGVQAGVDRISFAAGPGDLVALCESVAFADGTTRPVDCGGGDPTFPPQEIIDTLNLIFDTINGVLDDAYSVVDPVICPVLTSLAGSYGPITIKPDGDVYVPDPLVLLGGPVYDCPPYGNF